MAMLEFGARSTDHAWPRAQHIPCCMPCPAQVAKTHCHGPKPFNLTSEARHGIGAWPCSLVRRRRPSSMVEFMGSGLREGWLAFDSQDPFKALGKHVEHR